MIRTVTLRLKQDEYDELGEAAAAERRSLSNFIATAALERVREAQFVDDAEMAEILNDDALVRSRAAERLPERVEAWRAKAGVAPPRVVVADQRKRWGSCDHRGTIRLNWRIVQAPMRLVDYVVVHELAHLRHRGHGRDYWRAVGRVMPDYERRRDELRKCGFALAW